MSTYRMDFAYLTPVQQRAAGLFEVAAGGCAPAVFTPRRRLRCQHPLRRFAGRTRGLGFVYTGTWVSVLRCYDAGHDLDGGGPASPWARWAANARDERDLLP